MAVVQIRHDTVGRAYYRRDLAEDAVGIFEQAQRMLRTGMEAARPAMLRFGGHAHNPGDGTARCRSVG